MPEAAPKRLGNIIGPERIHPRHPGLISTKVPVPSVSKDATKVRQGSLDRLPS